MKYFLSLFSVVVLFWLLSCQQKTEAAQSGADDKSKVAQVDAKATDNSLAALPAKDEASSSAEKPRIFITGSTTGLGELAAKALVAKGYRVVVHARNERRAADVRKSVPGAEAVVMGDLSSMEETKKLAAQVNKLGTFDAVIMNAGVYYEPSEVLLKVNVLAPYILTSLLHKPKRLIYISSDMHLEGNLKLDELAKSAPNITYPDSKLMLLTLAMAASRKWPDVYVNAVHPGWVPTRMGGANAPDDLDQGYETQVWLAEGIDKETRVSGHYFFHKKEAKSKAIAKDTNAQEKLLRTLEKRTGVAFPDK
jgi:NAD(P)-dependent dehydrogenase (short-subunit alcohol dehydrogenase family)